jgi:hypothetical protein
VSLGGPLGGPPPAANRAALALLDRAAALAERAPRLVHPEGNVTIGENRLVTLVVARITPLGVRMAADMRVTDPSQIQRGYVHAALKAVLLSPTVCVGYAGNIGFALHAIREIASLGVGFDAVQARLLAAHRDSKGVSEFLVAGLRPSRLVQIKEGGAAFDPAGWIGDGRAFREYQAEYHRKQWVPPREMYDSNDRAEDIEIAIRMKAAMDAVVEGPTSVGEGQDRVLTLPQGGDTKLWVRLSSWSFPASRTIFSRTRYPSTRRRRRSPNRCPLAWA